MIRKVPALVAGLLLACPMAGASAGRPQQASGTGASGTPSKTTTSKKKSSRKRHGRREPTQKAPTPERISEIQSSLARAGYYQGDPNGKWDANSVAAMQKFQAENGLDATGKIDALSLQKLGLGSSVAGVSAPKQPVPAAPAATPSSPSTPAPSTSPGKPSSESSSATTQSASSSAPAATGSEQKPPQR